MKTESFILLVIGIFFAIIGASTGSRPTSRPAP